MPSVASERQRLMIQMRKYSPARPVKVIWKSCSSLGALSVMQSATKKKLGDSSLQRPPARVAIVENNVVAREQCNGATKRASSRKERSLHFTAERNRRRVFVEDDVLPAENAMRGDG